MAQVLSCWKDIARYVGKGVRTVQRWEDEMGFPIRRAGGNDHKAPVFAIPEEIDAWIRTWQRQPDELERLRRENSELREEIRQLRVRLGEIAVLDIVA